MFPRSNDLISQKYVVEQQILHASPKGYGGKGSKWASTVLDLMTEYDAWSVLDYGCGQGSLMRELSANGLGPTRLREYDPAIPEKNALPSFTDLVVCTDVLEHCEPERLDAVLRHLVLLARKAVFLAVATRPSNKRLSDGRNAHLIVKPAEWWEEHVYRVTGWQVHHRATSKPAREWVAVLCPR